MQDCRWCWEMSSLLLTFLKRYDRWRPLLRLRSAARAVDLAIAAWPSQRSNAHGRLLESLEEGVSISCDARCDVGHDGALPLLGTVSCRLCCQDGARHCRSERCFRHS